MSSLIKKPAKYVDSDMAGAPQVNNTVLGNVGSARDMSDILLSVLVTGFGTGVGEVSPLGWSTLINTVPTAPMDGTSYQYLIVLANASNTVFVELEMTTSNDSMIDTAGSKWNLKCYHQYVDFSNKSNHIEGNGNYWSNSTAEYNQLTNWFIVGSDDGFIMYSAGNNVWGSKFRSNTSNHMCLYVGRLKSFAGDVEIDTALFRMFASSNGVDLGWSQSWLYKWNGTKYTTHTMRNLDSSGGNIYGLFCPYIKGYTGKETTPTLSQPLVATPVMLIRDRHGSNVDLMASPFDLDTAPAIRGIAPGLVMFDKAMCASDSEYPVPNIQTFDGVKHVMIPAINGGQSVCWINCEEW